MEFRTGNLFARSADNGEWKSLQETVDGWLGDFCSLERPEHNLGEARLPKRILTDGDSGLLSDAKVRSLADV